MISNSYKCVMAVIDWEFVSKQMQNATVGNRIVHARYGHASQSNHCLKGPNVSTSVIFHQQYQLCEEYSVVKKIKLTTVLFIKFNKLCISRCSLKLIGNNYKILFVVHFNFQRTYLISFIFTFVFAF